MSLDDEQKKLRAEAYGASEVATVVGRGFGNLAELYESKANPAPKDEDLDDMLAAELGTLEEEPVAKVYARRTGTFLAPVGTLRHPTRLLAVATPDRARFTSEEALRRALLTGGDGTLRAAGLISTLDGLAEAERLVEVKTHAGRFRKEYGREGSGQVPEQEAIQVTWQMGVTGQRVVDLPVLFRGDWGVKLEVFTVAFSAELFEWLYESVERFHVDHVLARKPPPPDGTKEYDKVMERLHSTVRKAHLTATPEDEDAMLRWAKFAAVEKRAAQYKARVGQSLMERVGDAAGLVSADLGKLSWISVAPSSRIDWQQAANEALTLSGLCLNAFDRLKQVGEHLSDENRAALEARLKEIMPLATKPKNGFRYLKLSPKGEADLALARLRVALDALGDGT